MPTNQRQAVIQNEDDIREPHNVMSPNRIVFSPSRDLLSPAAIFSPNASASNLVHQKNESGIFLQDRLIKNSEQTFTHNKQKYFFDNDQLSKNDEEDLASKNQKDSFHNNQLKGGLANEEQSESVQQARDVKEKGTYDSSAAGIRKSPFYRKYELILSILFSRNSPREIYLASALLCFCMVIGTISCGITIKDVSGDLKTLLNQVDMLQITNYFMAPFAQFTLERFAINRYDEMLTFNYFSQEVHDNLTNYMKPLTATSFDQAKFKYTQQIENVQLQQFFKDNYVMVSIGTNSSNQNYRVTFRQSLELLIQVQWLYNLAIKGVIDRKFIRTLPVYYYQYANLQMYIEQCQTVDAAILIFILESCDQVSRKWTSVMILFLILVLITTLFSWLTYVNYLKKVERLFYIFKFLSTQHIQLEIERIKVIIGLIIKNDNLIFNYHFSLESKEKALQKQINQKLLDFKLRNKWSQIDNSNQINRNFSQIQISKLKSAFYIVLLILFSISTLSTITTQNITFLSQFGRTSVFFKDLSDLGFHIPYVFIAREMLFNLSAVPLNTTNVAKTYQLLDVSMQGIGQFVARTTFFQSKDYLISDQFVQSWSRAKTTSLCQFVPENLREQTEYYCQQSLGGSLNRGLQIGLHQIFESIQTERAINNFTKRTIWPYLQFEGAYVIWTTTDYLTDQLKQAILDVTNNWLDIIYVIYLFLSKTLCLSCILYQLVIIVMILAFATKSQVEGYKKIKRILSLMPSATLYTDDQFERYLKLIISRDKIL